MSKKFCALPSRVLETAKYFQLLKGTDYAYNFLIDILEYGINETPIENNYPETQINELLIDINDKNQALSNLSKGGRKSTVDDNQIRKLRESGMTITQIATTLCVSPSTIKKHLSKMGI